MYNYLLTFFEKRLMIIPPELTFCGLLPVLQTCFLNPFTSAHLEQELPLTLTVLLMGACEQALCLGKKKIARKEKGKGRGGGGREPVDKHLRPLLSPLVITPPNICQ